MKFIYTAVLLMIMLQVQANTPTQPATNLGFYAIDGGYFNIGGTAGNGARRIIIGKAGSPVTFIPQDGASYQANTNFADGQEVAPGEYVLYNNAFSSFYLTGLTAATTYYFAVFEYNGTGASTAYLTQHHLTGSATTSAMPTLQATGVNFLNVTATTVTISWTNGNGSRRLVLAKEAAAVDVNPVNNTPYTGNSSFGNGATTGNGNYAVLSGSGNSVVVTNLKAGTAYHFAVYEFNGNTQPQYLQPGATASVTTRTIPTIPSSAVTVTKADGKALSLAWTNGNGQRRIIVAKKGSAVTAVPVNNSVYAASSIFGAGHQLAAGEYVVFDDNFHAATISGLTPGSEYFFKIYEYDGGTGTATYLTSASGTVSGSTINTPTVQSRAIQAAAITAHGISLQFAPGNGRARLIVARKNEPVNVMPQDFTVYISNDYGKGTDLGDGNYVVGNATGNAAGIQNLEPNTLYHFAVWEYNGFEQPMYLTPAAVFSATTSAPLPVKLSSFKAITQQQSVLLQWTTSMEQHSSYFVVERSSNGIHFETLQQIQAAGNSSTLLEYRATDKTAPGGKLFYRLKCVDKDGSFEYSAVQVVQLQVSAAVISTNPVAHTLQVIRTTAVPALPQMWQIVSAGGQVLRAGKSSGSIINIDVAALPPGNYWLRLPQPGSTGTVAFVKL
ncbi:MAG TPA: hypothetical protein PKC39_04790 [Ferruginibacter sp.]|nr:hypothetical protein [Ferruginibacter sp.]